MKKMLIVNADLCIGCRMCEAVCSLGHYGAIGISHARLKVLRYKLERETHDNLSFMWLMGGLKPDHKTISEFRRKNKKKLKKVIKLCARLCIKLGLIDGNVLFIDGTKIRANAARGKTRDKAWYKEQLKNLDQRIERLLNEYESIDQQEHHKGSLVTMNKELAKTERLKNTVQKALEEFKRTDKSKINQTDPDCSI